MLPDIPDDLRFMLPYLQRASELKMKDAVMAYYCLFYAVQLSNRGYPRTPANSSFLMALLDELEAEKEALKEEEAIQNDEAAKRHVLQFALKVFLAADNEDRGGQATKKTARFFLVASQFLEVLRVFGDPGREIEERIRYAKWKASDIVKALNEGRQPASGPPTEGIQEAGETGESQQATEEARRRRSSAMSAGSLNPSQPQPATSPPPAMPQPANLPSMAGSYFAPEHPTASSPPASTAPAAPPLAASSARLTMAQIGLLMDAEKHSRYATSAIQFEHVDTAIKELELAIGLLRRLPQ